jgi:3-mercaptopyruvate sulfurtransferase SseA
VALELRKKGISKVRPLAGGFFAWRDKGLPLVRPTESSDATGMASDKIAG